MSRDTLQLVGLVGLLLAVLVGLGILIPGFLTLQHLLDVSQTAALLGIVSIGQTLAILTGGIDLSIAAILVLANIVGGELMHGELTLVPALICLFVGTIVGLGNGLGIGWCGIPPMVMTLATAVMVTGYTHVHSEGLVRGSASPLAMEIGTGAILSIPNLTLLWIALSLASIVVLRFTTLGRRIYAVGSNPACAHAAGIGVREIRTLVYTFSGALAGLAGFLLVGYLGNPISGFTGQSGYTLDSIGAVIIGGTVFSGARGGVERTVVGVLIFKVLFSGLVMLQVGAVGRLIVTGLILIFILAAHNRIQGIRWLGPRNELARTENVTGE